MSTWRPCDRPGSTGVEVIARQTYDVACSPRHDRRDGKPPPSLPAELVDAVCTPEVVSQIWSARIIASKPA